MLSDEFEREQTNVSGLGDEAISNAHCNSPSSSKKKLAQLLQHGVVTRRAAAAAGLKVEDQVSDDFAFLLFPRSAPLLRAC